MADKPSLINPNFEGLWSVSRLGHINKKWYSKAVGTFVLSLYYAVLVSAFVIPFVILFLLYIKFTKTGLILSIIIAVPYFVNFQHQDWFVKFLLYYGAYYFSGGISQIIEKNPKICDSHQPMCVCYSPHGIICPGFVFCAGTIYFAQFQDDKISKGGNYKYRTPKHILAVSWLPLIPIINFFFAGYLKSSGKKTFKALMKSKTSFAFIPGGMPEATIYEKSEHKIYILKRKGFIKYCLQFGYEIVPCYIFGEGEVYTNLTASSNKLIIKIKKLLNKYKIPAVIPCGPYWFFPLLPYNNIGLHAVYSSNTRCDHVENPTQKEIDECHEWYKNEIKALFDRHKWRFGYSQDVELKMV